MKFVKGTISVQDIQDEEKSEDKEYNESKIHIPVKNIENIENIEDVFEGSGFKESSLEEQEIQDEGSGFKESSLDETIPRIISYFDFETCVDNKEQHVPYCLCIKINSEIKTFIGLNCVQLWIKYFKTIFKKQEILVQMYAHNAGFDVSFMLQHLQFNHNSLVQKDGQFYSFSAKIPDSNINIKFVDSLKILNMPLSKIPKFLGLTSEKELFDYSLNTVNNFIEQYLSFNLIKDDNVREHFMKISEQNKYIVEGVESELLFDFHKYSEYYCKRDVEVLSLGMEKCDEIMQAQFGASVYDFLTISSYADNYMKRQRCYDRVMEVGGICRDFIQKCVIGGRVMCNNNQKQWYECERNEDGTPIEESCINDFDGVSLYPSSMNRVGLPCGNPMLINNIIGMIQKKCGKTIGKHNIDKLYKIEVDDDTWIKAYYVRCIV